MRVLHCISSPKVIRPALWRREINRGHFIPSKTLGKISFHRDSNSYVKARQILCVSAAPEQNIVRTHVIFERVLILFFVFLQYRKLPVSVHGFWGPGALGGKARGARTLMSLSSFSPWGRTMDHKVRRRKPLPLIKDQLDPRALAFKPGTIGWMPRKLRFPQICLFRQ